MLNVPQAQDNPTYPAQAIIDACDFAALAGGSDGTGIVSGLTYSAISGCTVTIASGSFCYQSTAVSFAGGSVTFAAGGSHDRKDILTITADGALAVVQGTPCTIANWTNTAGLNGILPPVKPALPSTSILLYEVYVPGSATSLTVHNLVEKRVIVAASASGAVTVTGDQTIGGVKTYTQSPIVPDVAALSADEDAANTKYVDSAVAVEKTRAEGAESTNATAITAETTARTTAVSNEATTRANADTTLAGAISTETSRAETAESGLSTSVSNETTRAEGAESTLSTAITTETTRAETAEALKAPLASPALTGAPTTPDVAALDDGEHISNTKYVDTAVGVEKSRALSAESTITTSVSTETSRAEGAESGLSTAISTETSRAETAEALLAPLASPALTGTPTAPTKTPLTNNTDVATTAYADAAVAVEAGVRAAADASNATAISSETSRAEGAESSLSNSVTTETSRAEGAESTLSTAISAETTRAEGIEATKAPLASPALTGAPTAPTAAALTNDTQLATTAYADTAVGVEKTRALAAESTLSTSVATETTRAETAEALLAPLASPALTGSPTAPTKTALTSNTDIATTAYADSAVGVETAARAAAITAEATTRATADSTNATAITTETTRAETAEALLAPLASPALTGTPTAPTKTALTNNTDIATTAYADAAVGVETASRAAAITSEASSRTSGDATNATAITAETSRAEGVEATKGSRAHTVSVAASNAANPSQYDYQCTGVSDEVTINLAIATLTNGGICKLSEGAFYLGDGMVMCNESNVILVGAGMEQQGIQQANTTTTSAYEITGSGSTVGVVATASFPSSSGKFAIPNIYQMTSTTAGTFQGQAPVVGQAVWNAADSFASPLLTIPTVATGQTLSTASASLVVTSTTNWPSTGAFVVVVGGVGYLVTYTGISGGNTFTGCTIASGSVVVPVGYKIYATVASVNASAGTFTIYGYSSNGHVLVGATPTTDQASPVYYGLNPQPAPCMVTYTGRTGTTFTGCTVASGTAYIPSGGICVYGPSSPRQAHVMFGSTGDVSGCFVRDLRIGVFGAGPVNSGCGLKTNSIGRVNIENVHVAYPELDCLWLSNFETVNGTTTTIATGHDVATAPEPGTIETWTLTTVPGGWGLGGMSNGNTWTLADGVTTAPVSPGQLNGLFTLMQVDNEEVGIMSTTGATVTVIRGWGGTVSTHTNASGAAVSFFQRSGSMSEVVIRNASATAPGRDGISVGQTAGDSKFYECYAAGGGSAMNGGRWGIWSRGAFCDWQNAHSYLMGNDGLYHNGSIAYTNLRIKGGDFETNNGRGIYAKNLGYPQARGNNSPYGGAVIIEDVACYNNLSNQLLVFGSDNVWLSRFKTFDFGNTRSVQANTVLLSRITNAHVRDCHIAGGAGSPIVSTGAGLNFTYCVGGDILGVVILATGVGCTRSIAMTNSSNVTVDGYFVDCGIFEAASCSNDIFTSNGQLGASQQPGGYTAGGSTVAVNGTGSVYSGLGPYASLSSSATQVFNGAITTPIADVGVLVTNADVFEDQTGDEAQGAGQNALYAKARGGFDALWSYPSTGGPRQLGRDRGDATFAALYANAHAATINTDGATGVTTVGTISTGAPAGGSVVQQITNAASGAAQLSALTDAIFRIGTSAANYGFKFKSRLYFADTSYVAGGADGGARIDVGLSTALGTDLGTYHSPNSTQKLLFTYANYNGDGTKDTNWFLVTGDGTSVSSLNTGYVFTPGKVYDFWIWCPAGSSQIWFRIDNVTDGTTSGEMYALGGSTASGVTNTWSHNPYLPAQTTNLAAGFGLQTDSSAFSHQIRLARVHGEYDQG